MNHPIGHEGSEISWANSEARQPYYSVNELRLMVFVAWVIYLAYAYFTLISYSYFVAKKAT